MTYVVQERAKDFAVLQIVDDKKWNIYGTLLRVALYFENGVNGFGVYNFVDVT